MFRENEAIRASLDNARAQFHEEKRELDYEKQHLQQGTKDLQDKLRDATDLVAKHERELVEVRGAVKQMEAEVSGKVRPAAPAVCWWIHDAACILMMGAPSSSALAERSVPIIDETILDTD
jgi:hypothetical protein